MTKSPVRSGYTLPVFACAAALAALQSLRKGGLPLTSVEIHLIEPAILAEIKIEQVACLKPGTALAIARSDPGDNLDLTRHTPIWAMVELETASPSENSDESLLTILGGEGIGRRVVDGEAAINAYTRKLLQHNLKPALQPGEKMTVTIALPEGRQLAKRTSNEAFGIVEGLALLGTTGISQPLSAPGQLEEYREVLQQKTNYFDCLVFCVGENGLDLAQKLGVRPERLVKTANWLGPLLVEAAIQGVQSLLLFGYHGKLMKLAAGIFHTHHYLADGRREILTAYGVQAGLPADCCHEIFASATAEEALARLQTWDAQQGSQWVEGVYSAIAQQIDRRSSEYIFAQSNRHVTVGSVMFRRDRKIIIQSEIADTLFPQVC